MNDEKLDRHLKQAKEEAQAFFAHTDEEVLRKAVHGRLRQEKPAKRVRRIPKLGIACAAAVLVCILCVGGISFRTAPPKETGQQSTIQTESPVLLDAETGDGYRVGYYPVATGAEEPALAAVFWEGDEQNRHMVYSSIFENSDTPYPAVILDFPGNAEEKMVLVSTGSEGEDYLHYRLVRLGAGQAADAWTQDFVPGGRVGIQNGVIVVRQEDAAHSHNLYFVPYTANGNGIIELAVQSLDMKVGDGLVFIGAQPEALAVLPESGLFREAEQEGETILFSAGKAGEEAFLLDGADGRAVLRVSVQE